MILSWLLPSSLSSSLSPEQISLEPCKLSIAAKNIPEEGLIPEGSLGLALDVTAVFIPSSLVCVCVGGASDTQRPREPGPPHPALSVQQWL